MAIDKRTTRLGMLALVSTLLIGALGTRLWFLQGVEAASYQARVSAAKLREVLIPPERGASSTPRVGSWPTTNASSPSPSTGA